MRQNRLILLLNFMKKSFNFKYPIYLRRIKMPKGFDGDCQVKNNNFIIRIEKSFSEHYSIDILLHELSHCLTWNDNEESNAEMHGLDWGKAYSIIYRKFLEWNGDEKDTS